MPRCSNGVHHGNECLTGQEPFCPDGFQHLNGQCISPQRPRCPQHLTLSPDGDCVSLKLPTCEDGGVLLHGECFTGSPKCPEGTYFRDGHCISNEHPRCSEDGYEWFAPEGKCRKKDKTVCEPGYHEENGQCVSDTPGDCGELELRDGHCVHPAPPKCPEGSGTYWDGEDCRSPDPPDCGPGKVFKKGKNTCVTESEPKCDDPGTVLDKSLNKCVSVEGPRCPDGQRFNPATHSCVLVVGDCLEFEFCPVITSLSPEVKGL
jgi:hypothetical protein